MSLVCCWGVVGLISAEGALSMATAVMAVRDGSAECVGVVSG